jgi:uncharacterized protein (TIGR00297 family)
MPVRQHDEYGRKIVHILMGGFALTLRFIPWWQAALLAMAALVFNLAVLPRVAGQLYRPGERARGVRSGIVLYPLSVLLLVVLFPDRLDIAAAAWGILAVGDGTATIAGRRLGWGAVPWNREKSFAGSAALFLCGGVAGSMLAWWCRPNVTPAPEVWFSIAAPLVAALVAALVETIPVRLDDNISVPASAAAVLWSLSLVDEDLARPALATAAYAMPAAVAVNAVVAWLSYRASTVTPSGAVAGACIGTAIAVTTGWPGWLLLGATFLAASLSSRLGLARKTRLGIAEARGGRRGAGNAIANTGLAAVAALLSVLTYERSPALLAFVTALAAGGSDTVASEIGKVWGRRTYLVTTLRQVAPGTPGAISLEGTFAGIAGAGLLAGVGISLGLVPTVALVPIVAGATIGSFAESLLGASLEGPGILNNDWLNFINTAVAAAAAIIISMARLVA